MTKLRLSPVADEKPVRVIIEIPGPVHRDLVKYAEVLARNAGGMIAGPAKLIVPMLQQFMATDRAFAKAKRMQTQPPSRLPEKSE